MDDTRATFHVNIFDTGERACGGRSSSKALEGVDVDHGLQYFTLASDVARESFARPLVECGALADWSAAAVGALREGEFRAFDDDVARYVGVGGFRAMSEALESNADEVRRPQWVGAMSPSRFDDDGRATVETLAANASTEREAVEGVRLRRHRAQRQVRAQTRVHGEGSRWTRGVR